MSTPSLALKIFRFLYYTDTDPESWIPIIDKAKHHLFRDAYYGGSTACYKFKFDINESKDKELQYIDVNSLYPFAMQNQMPLKYLNTVDGMKLEDSLGFVIAYVTAPENIKIPLLIYKSPNGEILQPKGVFRGIWFSEELKAVKAYGYKIEVIKAHNFSKSYLFNDYVDFFYNFKKNATNDIEKTIAKMNLNSLYGMLGRKPNNYSLWYGRYLTNLKELTY